MGSSQNEYPAMHDLINEIDFLEIFTNFVCLLWKIMIPSFWFRKFNARMNWKIKLILIFSLENK